MLKNLKKILKDYYMHDQMQTRIFELRKLILLKDQPGILAKANDLEEGKSVYMQEILDHLSCYKFSLNEHAHWHNGLFPWQTEVLR